MKKTFWLRILVWTIVLYVLAAFGWWTYALVDYSSEVKKLNIKNIEDKCLVINAKLAELVLRGKFITPNAISFNHGHAKFMADTQMMKNFVDSATKTRLYTANELTFLPGTILEKRIHVVVHQKAIEYIENKDRVRRNGYLLEGATLTLLVLFAVYWLYRQFKNIITFNQQQNNFLLAVTHELKTPVAAIKLSAQTAMRADLPAEKMNELLKKSNSNADRLNTLIDNMLLVTRLDGNALKLEQKALDLSDIIRQSIKNLKANPVFTGTIEAKLDETSFVKGDPVVLQLAIDNLLENALKYSKYNVKIDINLNKGLLAVADNGIGIAPEFRKKVFKKFYRIGNECTRETKGTGLGLYLVKKIFKEHDANIWIESNEPQGTIFKIKFKTI